jgi:hypothetical protein
MSQDDFANVLQFVSGMHRMMLIGFAVCLLVVFLSVVRLAVSELGWAKSWSPTSTRRLRRARVAVSTPAASLEPIRSKAVAVTLRTRLADTAPRPGSR